MPDSKVLLITGASGGIGAATALLAAKAGYQVCVHYHHGEAAAQTVVGQIHAAGANAVAIRADVTSEKEVVALFEACAAQLGPLAALVNNAAILEQQMPLEQMDAARIRRVFDVNVLGSFLCAREAVRRMSTRHGGQGGAIVNVSSAAVKYGSPGEYVDYAASKGAIDVLTHGLAVEVAQDGIRVNAVRPGVIHTTMHAKGGEPNRVERVSKVVPMRRGGQPEEVAQAILWLLSGEASYVTGALLDVGGGR